MKFIWEEKDIICGRIVCKPITNPSPDLGWQAKWCYKIGFLAGGNPKNSSALGKDRTDYCIIALTDGMILNPRSKEDIAKWLNDNKMIPCPHGKLIEIMNYLRDCYEN